MNILEIAIKAEGSVSALASKMGIKPNVISNWRARQAVPTGWAKLLEKTYQAVSDKSTA